MKKIIILSIFTLFAVNIFAQSKADAKPTTQTETFMVSEKTKNKLPEGVEFINSKITLKKGYKFETSPDGKKVFLKTSVGGVGGSFTCTCSADAKKGSCHISIHGGDGSSSLTCDGTCNCSLNTTVEGAKNYNAPTQATQN